MTVDKITKIIKILDIIGTTRHQEFVLVSVLDKFSMQDLEMLITIMPTLVKVFEVHEVVDLIKSRRYY